MSRLTDLLKHARKLDAQLGADLEAEFRALSKRRTFGLVFEQHQPEAVELPGRPVRRGDKVRILTPRGETRRGDRRLWRVMSFDGDGDERVALLRLADDGPNEQRETQSAAVHDVIAVAEFRDTIYPGLVETGRIERGGGKPHHTVINSENFHALEMLTYTHRHRVDAIYIDPPYNTGARDWKYNNDYVEADDDYRHSKWLAMMERRLSIARELLEPDDSVLIVTIDEKEFLPLGLLLGQTFPEARIQMVTSVVNRKGSPRRGAFSRVEEYVFVVMIGEASVIQTGDDMLHEENAQRREVRWQALRREKANGGYRHERPAMHYPIFVDEGSGEYHSCGLPLFEGRERAEVPVPEGTFAVWPLTADGVEMRWALSRDTLDRNAKHGWVKFGRRSSSPQAAMVSYLTSGVIKDLEAGIVVNSGTDDEPTYVYESRRSLRPMSTWKRVAHDAGMYGSSILKALLLDRRFPFPKSLYAVEDALRFFVKDKPEAVILDFFAGSGTTAHAVMRLNRQDGGRRQSILVTNNEVAADEQKSLCAKGLRPGDPEWERWGICDYITKPRIEAAITGMTPAREPIKGDYRFTDEFPMSEGFEENAAFFTLTYEAPLSVAHHRAFAKIAPLLWLRAGSRGRIIEDLGTRGWDVADTYAVLENLDSAADFSGALAHAEGVLLAFIVTDDDSAFQVVCRGLPLVVSPIRLYESYLDNFRINSGRLD